jgi:hypothetical protein
MVRGGGEGEGYLIFFVGKNTKLTKAKEKKTGRKKESMMKDADLLRLESWCKNS